MFTITDVLIASAVSIFILIAIWLLAKWSVARDNKAGPFLCALGLHRWKIAPIVPFQFAPKAQCQRCGAEGRIDSQGMVVIVRESDDHIPPGPAL